MDFASAVKARETGQGGYGLFEFSCMVMGETRPNETRSKLSLQKQNGSSAKGDTTDLYRATSIDFLVRVPFK